MDLGSSCVGDDVTIEKNTGNYILKTGGSVGSHSYDTEGCARSFAGHNVNCHKAAEEADEDSDCNTEENHGEDIDPASRASEEEERQRNGLKDTGHEGGILPVTLEHKIREPTGDYGTNDTENRVDTNNGCGLGKAH